MSATMSNAGYRLDCADPSLAGLLSHWLDGASLSWPAPFTVRARIAPDLPEAVDGREVVHHQGFETRAGEPDGTVRIRWPGGPAEAVVASIEPAVDITLTPAAIEKFEEAERGFLLLALLFLLRRVGWYHVHGAALIDPLGRGWMLVGNSRTGKSTTSALLASRGWTVGTDDIAFLDRVDGKVGVHGFRSPIALRSGGRALLEAQGMLGVAGTEFDRRQKTGYTAEELGGRWTEVVVPQILVFPTVGGSTTLQPMRPGEILSELVTWSIWVLFEKLRAQEHLDHLSGLAEQSRGFRATFGPDLFSNPNLLMELLP